MAWRDYVLNNFWAKVLSVIFAALLWMTLSFGKEELAPQPFWISSSHRMLDVPVRVLRGASDVDYREFTLDPPTVDITLRGSAVVLRRIQKGEVKPFVALTELNRQTTNRVDVYLPPERGPAKVEVEPPQVRVTFSEGAER